MDKIISNNLKRLREISKYTQEETAKILGLPRSAYSNYESGSREVPFDVLEKAADFYGCDMALLFEENENVEAQMLATAFRIEGVSAADAGEILNFKSIVKSYLKMEALERR